MTLLVIFPLQESGVVGLGLVDSGEPVALFVPTNLQRENVLHCLGLFDELSIGQGKGETSPPVPAYQLTTCALLPSLFCSSAISQACS